MILQLKRSFLFLLPLFFPLLIFSQSGANAQTGNDDRSIRREGPGMEGIYSDFVLYPKRTLLEKDLRERIIGRTFSLPLDSNTEYKYGSACDAISQFLFQSPETERGFRQLFAGYDSLSRDTKKAFLEALYAIGSGNFAAPVRAILERETDPKLFAICAVYLHRCDPVMDNDNSLKIRMAEKFPGYDTVAILNELQDYLSYHEGWVKGKTPAIGELFSYQASIGQKIIWSFQRWDRDYPGLAIVQNADGSFVRDQQGKLRVFRQLARSGSDLPYFITDGSTPQGIYSIQGTAVSRTHFIGPTPNLQLIMPNEDSWRRYFLQRKDSTGRTSAEPGAGTGAGMSPGSIAPVDSLRLYQALLPPGWRGYRPMMEAWNAGRIGRTEIIAHGTTIDPEYFKGKPFYPLTPTMGCLCAEEVWNPGNGRLVISEQFGLVSAFLSTPGSKGYLYVINVDDQRMPVSRQEAEEWVKR
jgi:hypothetical protein